MYAITTVLMILSSCEVTANQQVDYAMEVYQTLHDKPPPKEMVARRERVFARLEELKAAAARLVAIVEDPAALQRLIDNGHYDWEGIQEEYGLPDSALDAYAELAKFNYDCGEYKGAGAALKMLLQLTGGASGSPRGPGALWGRLACEILTANPEGALHLIREVKQVIEFRGSSALEQLQQRSWLLHWSLFVFFHHANGRDELITLFFEEKFLQIAYAIKQFVLSVVQLWLWCTECTIQRACCTSAAALCSLKELHTVDTAHAAIQTNCPWLLRYLVTAIILTKTSSNRRQNIMADLIKVLEQEQGNYSDPITDFLECLYVHFDFDGAMARCKECEQFIVIAQWLLQRLLCDCTIAAAVALLDYCSCYCITTTVCCVNSGTTVAAAAMSSIAITLAVTLAALLTTTAPTIPLAIILAVLLLLLLQSPLLTAAAANSAAQRLLPVQCVR
eukprot:8593-Heterococcus_DN1.PRE.2